MILRLVMEICLSTQFGHAGDGYGGRTPTIYYDRPVSAQDMGIAHREFPIGATVRVTNLRTGKTSRALVIDRGPYGKLGPKGEWFNGRKHRKRKGEWRGCADLTPRLARAIGHNGKETVQITLLKEGRKRWRKKQKQLPKERQREEKPRLASSRD